MKIWALHGFLGLPSDFNVIEKLVLEKNNSVQWTSVDYMHSRELSPHNDLQEWGAHFNRLVQKNSSPGESQILLGYSQGGRLALHALKDNPALWSKVILVSPNPGINAWEKSARLENDQEWAESFLHEKWDKVVMKWNAAAVFQGSNVEPARLEENYNRRQLAECLTNWSVGKQEDFRPFLEKVTGNVFYIAGEKDAKYCLIGKELYSKNRKIQFIPIQNSGHRVVFDQPEALSETVSQILAT